MGSARSQCVVLTAVAVNENVPLEFVCEPVHVPCVLDWRPVFVPYDFEKFVGEPPVGVNVPLIVSRTQCVLLIHAEPPLDA